MIPKIESKVYEVYVDNCCGTWCIYLRDIFGEKIKIAQIDIAYGSREEAEKYARKLNRIFKVKNE